MYKSLEQHTKQTCSTSSIQKTDHRVRYVMGLGVALLLLDVTGCGVGEHELSSRTQELVTGNGLTPTALEKNLPALSALGGRALSSAGPVGGAWPLDSETAGVLAATAAGRRVLSYAMKCALDRNDVVVVESDYAQYKFSGGLGVAPEWKTHGALEPGQQHAVSACVLAHVNVFGVTVPISLRDYRTLDTSADEKAGYESHEATFFGNLFSASPAMYVCSGDSDMSTGDGELRQCSVLSDASSVQTRCGFTLVGSCRDVCDSEIEGSYRNCWDSPARDGLFFAETMSVWLDIYG
ncbi:MAG: hypothetical protein MJE77_46595 [Proteobacteria bacterium]|nr:hypothetical protein [Pseudomonadota bacterium]